MARRRLADGRTIECCAACPFETWSLDGPGAAAVHGKCDETGKWLQKPDRWIDAECPLPCVKEEADEDGR